MSGTRFARTGRCRFLICFGILVLMVGMVAIFHSSQIQLDETREQRLHCEQQQEALNERLTSLVEQKFHLEKNQERERTEYLETKRNLEQKIKDLEEKHEKEQVESQMRYDKLQQAHKLLQSDHKRLKEENLKASKQQLENINGLENKLQSLRSELKREKTNKSGEMYMYREKYNTAEQEITHLRHSLSQVQNQLKEYQLQGDNKAQQELSRKPVAPKPDIAGDVNTSTSEKSFKQQDPVSEGVYHIAVNISNSNNKDTKTLSYTNVGGGDGRTGGHHDEPSSVMAGNVGGVEDNNKQTATKQDTQLPNTNPVFKPLIAKQYNGSLILNSVENFQIVPPKPIKSQNDHQPAAEGLKQQVAPLSAPKNKGSTATSKSEQQMAAASALNATSANTRNVRGNGSSSTSNTPPLPLPPNQKRQLPENVAPIPDDFEEILQKSNNNDQLKNPSVESNKDDDNAMKASPLKLSNNNNNNNYDFAGHEMKDNDNLNDDSNIPHDEDIFDTDNDDGKEHHKQKGLDDAGNNDDDDGGGLLGGDNDNDGDGGGAAAGDIAVKHNQQQIDANLKNEIAEDQGKEFGDGLRLDEGAMEEDDDDDYSNPSARKKADKAVRH